MIPLWYFLIPYALFAFLGFVALLVNVFHILKFGLQSTKTTLVLAVYILAFLSVCVLSLLVIFSFDWNQKIELGEALQSGFDATLIDL